MIELDYNQLDEAAKSLAQQVVERVPAVFTQKARWEFTAFAQQKMFQLLSADTPCDIPTSIGLFNQVFASSVVPTFEKIEKASSLEEDFEAVLNSLDFTVYAQSDEVLVNDPQERMERVKEQMQRCHDAIATREEYYVQHLFDNKLSMEADKNNIEVFEAYFQQLKNADLLHNVCPPALLEYVQNLVDQTFVLQSTFKDSWDVTAAIKNRRHNQNTVVPAPLSTLNGLS